MILFLILIKGFTAYSDINNEVQIKLDSAKYYFHGNIPRATTLLNQIYEKSQENQDSLLMIKVLILQGRKEFLNGNSHFSRQILFRSLKLCEKLGQDSIKGEVYDNLSMVYRNNRQFKNALKYYDISYKIRNKFNDTLGLINLLINRACLERDRANLIKDKSSNQFISLINKSDAILDSALSIAKKHHSRKFENEIYYLKGINSFAVKDYTSSLNNYLLFVEYQREYYNKKIGSELYLRVAVVYSLLGDKYKANIYLDSALNTNLDNLTEMGLYTYYGNLIKTYESLGNYKQALYYSMKSTDILYKQMTKSESERISKTQSEYERSIKIIKIEKLEIEKENQQNIIIAGSIILALLTFIIYQLIISKRKSENKTKIIESQSRELHQNLLLKDKFYSMIAHDIKNPMIGLSSTLEKMLTHKSEFKPDQINQINNLYSSSSELIQLFNNLLHWINIKKHNLKIENQKISLKKIIDKVISINHLYAETKNINLENSTPNSMIAIADYNILFSILHNLLHNAIKFSYENSSVRMVSYFDNNKLKVDIIDSGIGMSGETIAFLKSKNHTTEPKNLFDLKSSGLGLQIVSEYIEYIEGQLEIDSKEDKGTKITLILVSESELIRFNE